MRIFLLAMLLLALLCGTAVAGLWIAFALPADGVQLVINDHTVDLRALDGWHAFAGGLATMLALLIVIVVVPLALMFAVALPLLLVLGAVALLLGPTSSACAPIWPARPAPPRTTPTAGSS